MLFSATFRNVLGNLPPPAVVAPGTISLNPSAPGDLGAPPQSWTTKISAPGRNQVKWYVGLAGQKIINVAYNSANINITVPNYNRGDTINFTGYGAGFSIVRVGTTGSVFKVQGASGYNNVTVGNETRAENISYQIDGSGGTNTFSYSLLDLTNGEANLTVPFWRGGDSLIIRSLDEAASAASSPVVFSGAAVRSIVLTPREPGDLLTPPKDFTTTATAVGMSQVKWAILDSDNNLVSVNYTIVDLVGGTASITANFTAAGQKLTVRSIDDIVSDTTGPVAFNTVAKSITLNPQNPGDLGTAPKTWQTAVTAVGLPQIKWAVFDANFNSSMTWQVVNTPNGTATINPVFNKAGDRVVVKSIDDLTEKVSGQVSFGTVVVPPPPDATDDYTFIKNFFADLTIGPNIEREAGAGRSVAYFTKLKEAGCSHVRIFVPTKNGWGFMSNTALGGYCDSIANAIAAGLKVILGCQDVVLPEDAYSDPSASTGGKTPLPATITFLERFGQLIADKNFDKRKLAINAVNEWGYDRTNEFYRIAKNASTKALRSKLPGFLLIESSSNWNHPDKLTDGTFSLSADPLVCYEWHSYDMNAEKLSAATAVGNKVKTWADSKKVFTFCGEWGKGPANGPADGIQTTLIPEVIDAIARGAGHQRPLIWTITNGSWWRMNGANTLDLKATNVTALKAADTYIKTQPYYVSPDTSTPDPTPTPGVVSKLEVLHRGQSNAYYADQYGGPGRLRDVMASLTGLPVTMVSRKEQTTGDNTLHSGTYTFWRSPYNSDPRWIVPPSNDAAGYGSDPATWTNAGPLNQTLQAMTNFISSDEEVPLFDFSVHWEYDLGMEDSASRTAYLGGERQVTARIRNRRPKKAGKVIRAYGYCPYESSNYLAFNAINNAWAANVADTTRNAIYACGNMMDGQKNTQYDANGDNAHWGDQSGPRIYPRVGFVFSRLAYDRGWCPTTVNLSDCPSYGPRISSVARSGSTSVIATVVHDKGTSLVEGIDGIDWAAFTYNSNGGSFVGATGGAITGANTIRIDFAAALPSTGTEKLYYCFRPTFRNKKVIRDNWHSIRPTKYDNVPHIAVVEFPLQRTMSGVSF
ncbi:MAG: hypothetical protein AVDCRST_MAG95-1640 [uncultured Adhaeribacter sp.]|uniref:Glycoside hydrolase family 5 domain-containing protein n=1 Tax=uncultured Adhaeribacter sp. TaxID=448109 RepID=A0A6J4IAZ9_9BACT|nr:MAG: hypothetical protein AVDCRST_MAG95-1640 [uncultured Adhaeribacter sp.]